MKLLLKWEKKNNHYSILIFLKYNLFKIIF